MANDYKLQLGNKVYSNMNLTQDDFGMVRNTNQVYVHVNKTDNSDLLQLQYDPNQNQFLLGKVKVQADSSLGEGSITEKNVWVRAVSGDDTSTGGGGNTGGGTNTGGGGTNTGGGNTNTGGGNNTIVNVDLDNPDYAALLELLNVMQVQYDEEPLYHIDTNSDTNGTMYQSTGFRFVWAGSVESEFFVNCLRWKNMNVDGERFDGEVFLKVIEYEPVEIGTNGYGAIGNKITTVSSNSINQKEHNVLGQWYEWYFPKQISFKPNYVYVIVPHHDKDYDTITESSAKVTVFGSSDTNAAHNNITGIWTNTRQSSTNNNKTPIIQVCQKNPTTILMKR